MHEKKKAYVFIDGSNLYYDWRAANGNALMDIEAFIEKLKAEFDQYTVERIYYYATANQSVQQEKFFRRLSYIPFLTVKRGGLKTKKWANGISTTVDMGTDVNLATDMVYHAAKGHMDAVILVSRDSDFVGAVQIVKNEGIICETCMLDTCEKAQELIMAADNTRVIPVTEDLCRASSSDTLTQSVI